MDTELLDFLREAGRRREDIIVATDGGCLVAPGLEYWQRGAWAVIVKAGSSELELSGLLHGPEQTPAAAERMALAVIAEHTRVTGARGYVFSDNERGHSQTTQGCSWQPRWASGFLLESGLLLAWALYCRFGSRAMGKDLLGGPRAGFRLPW